MPHTLTLAEAVPAFLSHTPPSVWAILAVLVALGVRQMREHRMSRTRLTIAPLALGAYSLYGATAAFGWRPAVLLAWAAGMAGAVAANRGLRWPRQVRLTVDGAFVLRGSAWPLVLMLAVFAQRWVVGAAEVLQPAWRHGDAFAGPMALTWGLLSGLFLARALRVLSFGPGAARSASRGLARLVRPSRSSAQ